MGIDGSSSSRGRGLGDEVGVDGSGTVVGHALAQLDKGNGVNLPWNAGGNSTQSAQFFFGGEVLAIVQV